MKFLPLKHLGTHTLSYTTLVKLSNLKLKEIYSKHLFHLKFISECVQPANVSFLL